MCFQKLRVWCQLHDGIWESGRIKSTSGEKDSVLLSDGNVSTFYFYISSTRVASYRLQELCTHCIITVGCDSSHTRPSTSQSRDP